MRADYERESLPVPRRQIVWRGLRGRCPNCGGPLRFGRHLQLLAACPAPGCGLHWQKRDGFFLGAMTLNYTATVFGLLPLVVVAWRLGWIGANGAIGLGIAIGLVFPALFYKASWSLWLAAYYFFLPHELPANAGGAPPPYDDE